MKKLKCYLAGPMRGYENYNFPAFYEAQALLEMKGHNVVNPARMDVDQDKASWVESHGEIVPSPDFTFEDAMRRDIGAIALDRDSIVLMPGWEKSEGAGEELRAAKLFGLDVYLYVGNGEVKPYAE